MILTPLIVETPEWKHMLVAEDRGDVYFVCEQNPLLTMRTFGPPEKCPCCQTIYPTSVNPIWMEDVQKSEPEADGRHRRAADQPGQ